jgi:4-amino-4-deoxy-L-arabinose transferase-like glycosyltransferase
MAADPQSKTSSAVLVPDVAAITTTRRLHWLTIGLVIVIVAYVGFLLLVRLDVYPPPSFDEGAFLKVAKNYALNGVYADFSLGENRFTGAIVSTGPTVILPVALLYKIFGTSIALGRLVGVAYAIVLLLAIYALGRNLQNRRLALFAVVLIVLSPKAGFEFFGRSLLGELPGFTFVFAGLWLWTRPGKRKLIELALAGFLFGCGAITKNQYAPIILAGIFAAWMTDLFWYHRRGPLYYIVPGIVAGLCYAGWTYYVLFLIGAHNRDVAADIQFLRSTTTSSLILFNSTINNNNLSLLVQDSIFLVPAVIYGIVTAFRKDDKEQNWSVLTIFLVISMVMFIFSTGWSRYEVAPQVLATLIIARLVYDLTNGFHLNLSRQSIRDFLGGKPFSLAATVSLVVIVLLAGQLVRPTYLQIKDVATGGSNSPYLVQQYLNANVPLKSMITTYESDLGVLTNHAYIFAPNSIVVDLTVRKQVGVAIDPNEYNFLFNQGAEYVVIGPFAKSFSLYAPAKLQANYDQVFKTGDYEVYRVKAQTF